MKIYFAGAIRAGRGDAGVYQQIIALLKQQGDVLTEHVADANLTPHGEELSEEAIFNRDAAWLAGSDVVIAEVTHPSLGVGFELFLGHTLGKPVLCLYREQPGKRLSAIIAGNKSLTVRKYKDVAELPAVLGEFLERKK